MKMVFAIVRPEKIFEVNGALATAGFHASTTWNVSGRGRQHGIQVGDIVYDEMSKGVIMVVCEDESKNKVIDIIMDNAQTGDSGNSGDGRVFVVPVEESYTVSKQTKD